MVDRTDEHLVRSAARAVVGLAPALARLRDVVAERDDIRQAIERGHFTPEEEMRLRSWFARYLTIRAGMLETIEELRPLAMSDARVERTESFRAFVVAYTTACMLVSAARFLVADLATHRLVQRKLNEASAAHRIPRTQFTRIRRSVTGAKNAWRLNEGIAFADVHRARINEMTSDPIMGPVVACLAQYEDAVRVGVRDFLKARLRYRWHSIRRRRATAVQQSLYGLMEAFGRVIADVRNPWHDDRLHLDVREQLTSMLEPGDVIVTRHDHALSNLLLPGYWPHAALHIGLPAARDALAIDVPEPQRSRWFGARRVLEARKDGVRFRLIDDTLAVDAVTVLRPIVERPSIAQAIANALPHEGKPYNFDFDFFTDDRLVCTEVVYRAYEGVGGVSFALSHRGGRPTLSAEDIVSMAMEERGFRPVAVYGIPRLGRRIVMGAEATEALRALAASM